MCVPRATKPTLQRKLSCPDLILRMAYCSSNTVYVQFMYVVSRYRYTLCLCIRNNVCTYTIIGRGSPPQPQIMVYANVHIVGSGIGRKRITASAATVVVVYCNFKYLHIMYRGVALVLSTYCGVACLSAHADLCRPLSRSSAVFQFIVYTAAATVQNTYLFDNNNKRLVSFVLHRNSTHCTLRSVFENVVVPQVPLYMHKRWRDQQRRLRRKSVYLVAKQ